MASSIGDREVEDRRPRRSFLKLGHADVQRREVEPDRPARGVDPGQGLLRLKQGSTRYREREQSTNHGLPWVKAPVTLNPFRTQPNIAPSD